MRHSPLLALAPVLVVLLDSPNLRAQGDAHPEQDILIGTWFLVLEKSTFRPGPAPIRETRSYTLEGNELRGNIRRAFADGRSERIEFTANFDRVYPVTGTEQYDSLLLKRVDRYTAEAVLSHAGRVFGRARRVLSNDGKMMTISFRTEGDSGVVVNNIAVYEKIEPVTQP